jgi:hypothetical protein
VELTLSVTMKTRIGSLSGTALDAGFPLWKIDARTPVASAIPLKDTTGNYHGWRSMPTDEESEELSVATAWQ